MKSLVSMTFSGQIISTVTTGTAPLSVASTTKVVNLNSDLLDDMSADTASTASTVAARDTNGDLGARVLKSTVAIGTAPLSVTSTTKVTNLNADLLDDMNTATASTATTVAARDASGNLTAKQLVSDVAIGTAPLAVTSTTKVVSLNVDRVDDMHADTASTATTIAARDASGNITAKQLKSDISNGTAPLVVTSSTKVPNLNADMVDGISFTSGLDSAKPAATGSGSIYFSTDTNNIYRDSAAGVWSNLTGVVTVQSRNTVTLASVGNSVTIGIAGYNQNRDMLFVYANGTYVEKAEPIDGYNISGDSLTITKVTGNWNAGTIFNFVVIGTAQGNSPLLAFAKFENIFTASTNNTTHIPIGIANYNNVTDELEVYHSNVLLYPTDNYTINADGVSIDLTYGINSGEKIYFKVRKSVRTDITDPINNLIVAELESSFTSTSDTTTNCLINQASYVPSTDVLNVYYKNLKMKNGANYSLNANGISIDLLGWTLPSGDVIDFVVRKNVRSSIAASIDGGIIGDDTIVGSNKLYDKSVTVDKLDDNALTSSIFRQALINSNFDIWQRGTSFNSMNGYTVDRWNTSSDVEANIKITKSTDVPNTMSQYSFRIEQYSTTGASLAYSDTIQTIEDYKSFAGKTVTFSGYYKCDIGVKGNFYIRWNNSGGYSDVPEISANVWTKFSVTSILPSNFTDLATLKACLRIQRFNLAVGKGINFAQVQLNVGSVALPYQPKSYMQELQDCLRYYRVMNFTGHAFNSTNVIVHGMNFIPPMRITPSTTVNDGKDGAGNNNKFNQTGVVSIAFSGIGTNASDKGMTSISVTSPALSVGTMYDGSIKLDAEI